ncbi:MAG TPA: hypothetical protein PLH56_01580 [Candidatus Omnitrophota bacterium]|nr:hypothetical protein [Candidatus Omnitrophota bacterium]
MEKVICLVCHVEGYTASPHYVRCECGGALKVIKNFKEKSLSHKPKDIRKMHESLAHI